MTLAAGAPGGIVVECADCGDRRRFDATLTSAHFGHLPAETVDAGEDLARLAVSTAGDPVTHVTVPVLGCVRCAGPLVAVPDGHAVYKHGPHRTAGLSTSGWSDQAAHNHPAVRLQCGACKLVHELRVTLHDANMIRNRGAVA